MGVSVVRGLPRALVAFLMASALALVALLSPVGAWPHHLAFAEEAPKVEKVNVSSEAELVEAALAYKSDEATIVLASNIVLRGPLTIRDGMDVKIDLKGRTLSRDLDDFVVNGHVILIEEFGALNIVDTSAKGSGRISGGRARDGGGIYNRGSLNLTGATIVDCKAIDCGGGIHNSGTMTITSTWIEKCEAKGGGGIYNRGIAAVGAKNVQDNAATEIGGGILNDANMTITRCTIRRNTAPCAGGIASRIVSYTDTTTTELSGCTVTANTASRQAGGIYATRDIGDPATETKGKEHKGTLTIGGATKVTNNTSPAVGGIFCDYGHGMALTGATITGNTSTQGGWYSGTPVAGGVSFNGKANMANKDPSATFSIEGKNTIKSNKCDGVVSDTMMGVYDKMVVTDAFQTGTSIGITPAVGPIWEFTQDYADFNDVDPAKYFFTPAARSVKLRNGDVGLVEPVPYVDADGNDQVTDTYDLAESTSGYDWYEGTYVCYRNATLDDRVTLHGDVDLILCDDVTANFAKGIELADDKTWTNLHILTQKGETGTLVAEGGSGEAGIGSRGSTHSRLIMHAGTVQAIGGSGGAGIGGGDKRPGDDRFEVEIYGGTVLAKGGKRAAGIGCGTAGNLRGKVTIHGGDVTAVGSGGGAGIGGGANSPNYIDVEVLGGQTLAQSNYDGADAVGYGVGGDLGFAEVRIGESMMVMAGGIVDAYKRVPTCMSETWVSINPCPHTSQDYEYVDEKTHLTWCRYCGIDQHEETHRLAWDHTCACGYATPTYSITYDPAGGKGSKVAGEKAYEGETLTLADCTIWPPAGQPPSGKAFLAWDVAGERRQPGDTVVMTGNVVAKAVWSQACRVTFSAGEGSGRMDTLTCAKGSKLTLPESTLTGPNGKGFAGWKLKGKVYAAGETVEVTGDLGFVAQWGMNWKMLQSAIDAAGNGDTIVLTNDVTAAEDDVALRVAAGKNVTIELAGHAIDRHLGRPKADGHCMFVAGTLNIVDSSEDGTGVITGANNANRHRGRSHELVGGGIVVDEGTVTLSGGTITGNEGADGAGVQLVSAGSTFRMSGGAISDNVAHGAGGGVYVEYRSTFAMTGGSITNNTVPASEDRGEGEEGAGIYMFDSIEVEGDVTISGNTSREGRANNVYMAYGNSRIRVIGTLAPTAPIGVTTRRPNPVVYITDHLTSNGRISDFVADDPTQVVAPDGDEAVMRRPSVISFDAGTQEVDGPMEPLHAAYGLTIPLPEPTFTSVTHSTFRAWSIEGRTYEAGQDYYVRGSVTATALWDEAYAVTFDAAGGTGTCDDVYVAAGKTYDLPLECPFEAPAACEFVGWSVEGAAYGPGEPIVVEGPTTVTAVWDMTWAGLQRLIDREGQEELEVTLPHDLVAREQDGPLTIPEDMLVTIDLAGHAIDRALSHDSGNLVRQAGSAGSWGSVFHFTEGYCDLTIKDGVGGGTITGANGTALFASDGPNVFIDLTDVTVTGNEVTDGICADISSLALVRSAVTGNHGTTVGGVHVGPCSLKVGEGSTIIGNTCEGKAPDVLIGDGSVIEVEGMLADAAIGVSTTAVPRSGSPVRLTSGLFGYGDEGSLVGQQEGYLITVREDDEAYLVVPTTITVEQNGGVGSMEVEPMPEGISYPLPACTITPPAGKVFGTWLVAWDNGSKPIEAEPDTRVTLDADLMLMPLWTDHEHVLVEVPAQEPTCTEDGWYGYWSCAVTDGPCGRIFADGQGTVELNAADVVRPATGHVPGQEIEENRVEATEDTGASYDLVTYCSVCGAELGRDHVTKEVLDPVYPPVHVCKPGERQEEDRQPAMCDEAGHVMYVTYCTVCGEELEREMQLLDALGHDWGEVTYVWADDLSSVTATHVCTRDATHIETETAGTASTTKPVEESSQKLVTYTATFKNEAFGTASRTKLVSDGDGEDPKPTPSGDVDKPTDEDAKTTPSDQAGKPDDGGGSTSPVPTHRTDPGSTIPIGLQDLSPRSSRPYDPLGGIYDVLYDDWRWRPYDYATGRSYVSGSDDGEGSASNGESSANQTAPTQTQTPTPVTPVTTPGGSTGTTAAGAQPVGSITTAPAVGVALTQPTAQARTMGVANTGGDTADAGGDPGNAAPEKPLATTADGSRTPSPFALAGTVLAGAALAAKVRRRAGRLR